MATEARSGQPFDKQKVLVPIASAVFLILCIRSAWVGDDAYITLRTVDNFVNGYGLTWNTAERVQAYTHPLWMFALSAVYFVTREAYHSTVALSLILSTCTVVFVGRIARDVRVGAIAILVLGMSKAFVDYSASGLENPLTHLIIVVYVTVFAGDKDRNKRFVLLNLLACLAVLNRMDALLLFIPSLVYAGRGLSPVRILRSVAIGFSPFLLWELFSIIYYGFPFPNTAYAKLGSGIPSFDFIAYGFLYLKDSLTLDPITLGLIALGTAIPLIRREGANAALVAGSALYLIYVVRIGGDFMSGRFLTAPLLLAVFVLCLTELPIKACVFALIATVGFGLYAPHSPLRSDAEYGAGADFSDWVVMDERARYFPKFGLLNVLEKGRPAQKKWLTFAPEGEPVVRAAIGFVGFSQGSSTHIVDYLGLADPLLSRLPNHALDWKIGHYPRVIPVGYLKTISTGENVIEPADIGEFYTGLKTITRGPLFSLERFGEIVRYNLGLKDSLVDDAFETQRRNNEAQRLFLAGDYPETIALLKESGSLENNPEAAYLLSKALRLEGKVAEASGWILKAFEQNHRKLAYQYELFAVADALAAAGRQEEVILFYDNLIAIRPEYGGVYMKKGFILIENGNVDEGVLSLWRAVTYFSVADKQISAWIKKNNLDISVLGPLRDLLPFDHRDPESYVKLYDFHASRGDIAHSEHALVTAMAVTGWNKRIGTAIVDHIGDALVEREFAATGQFLTRLFEIREDVGILQFYAGFVHEHLGQNERAAARYRIVTRLIPEDPIAYSGLARVLRLLERFEEAEKAEATATSLRERS